MKLRSLRLHGFKSFADRTQLDFRDGITAIVGSNGCGKSNIADAVRWVLGEQRASAIRGARMDEVIFQGTARRRALNFAEVALLFSNEDGRVAIPQTEIEVARKTFREGGSEYAMNREACRLRDINNLLRGTGLGSNAYSVIEANMVETLLSDRAEERRSLFEEAAGIGRYKDSRVSTTRRLEAAEADLARLGDLIAEVESKVRVLARQRRRAQRLTELRARRLALEVALAEVEVTDLEASHGEATAEVERSEAALAAARAARAAAELELGAARAAHAELAARRAAHADRLESVRAQLHARERDAVLSRERRGNAELRLAQLIRERGDVEGRRAAMVAEARRLDAERSAARERLAAAREQARLTGEASAEARAALAAERNRADSASLSMRDLARDLAAAEGERDGLRSRAREAELRRERIREREEALAAQLAALDAEGALVPEQIPALEAAAEAAAREAAATDEALVSAQQHLRACEGAMREAESSAAAIGARLHALEGVERTYEGFAPAISAIMADRDLHRGVHGPLADFVVSNHPDAPAAEAVLGPMLHALVVDDLDAARRLRRWFRDEWSGGGRLVLLPLDAPTLRDHGEGDAPDFARGPGAPWVAALLAGLDAQPGGDPLDAWHAGRTRVGGQGDSVDPRGVVTLTARESGEGLLGRRAALAVLRSEHRTAEREGARRAAAAASAAETLRRAEAGAAQAAGARREAESALARARDAHALVAQRRSRLDQERNELASEVALQQRAAADHASRAAELDAHVESVRAALTAVEAEAARERERIAALEAGLEQAREADAERRVALARAEAALQEAERRHAGAVAAAESAAGRLTAIGGEAEALREMLESLSGHGERADEEARALTAAREEAVAEIARLDAGLADVARDADAAEGAVRASIADAESLAERRHAAALRAADAASRAARVRERLEAEWGRDWETIARDAEPPGGGEPDAWRRELAEVVHDVDAIGPVNMLAVEEHEEERRRLEFLLEQQRDLVASRDDLLAAIRQINRTAREVFVGTFESIREHFQRTFHALFEGGECDVRLADPADPLESAIEIQASPRGKKTQRIHLLSGGERTLTALALLFAIYLVKPSPFCLLDEVDAPLDESNVGRFIHLLQEWKAETQFIVITHNTRTMEAADWVYGVTMEEPGVSSIVGVELEGDPVEAGRVA